MINRSSLQAYVWEQMGELEHLGLGSREDFSDSRDKFVLKATHPAARALSTRPHANGFVRSDTGGLLFRDATFTLRNRVPADLQARAKGSDKGLEFGWGKISINDINTVFRAIRELAGAPPAPLQTVPTAATATRPSPVRSATVPRIRTGMGSSFSYELDANGVDEGLGLIYKWEIFNALGERVGVYVGKAKGGAERPATAYARNVANLLAGRPYRKNKPDQYRRVHRALAEAVTAGHHITLTFVCNVPPGETIDACERRIIRESNATGPEPWQLND